jgi:hypothetical protein
MQSMQVAEIILRILPAGHRWPDRAADRQDRHPVRSIFISDAAGTWLTTRLQGAIDAC